MTQQFVVVDGQLYVSHALVARQIVESLAVKSQVLVGANGFSLDTKTGAMKLPMIVEDAKEDRIAAGEESQDEDPQVLYIEQISPELATKMRVERELVLQRLDHLEGALEEMQSRVDCLSAEIVSLHASS